MDKINLEDLINPQKNGLIVEIYRRLPGKYDLKIENQNPLTLIFTVNRKKWFANKIIKEISVKKGHPGAIIGEVKSIKIDDTDNDIIRIEVLFNGFRNRY